MSGRFFVDTNVFVYTFDDRDAGKLAQARAIVDRALRDQDGVISFQVVQEFLNLATRKFARPLAPADASLYLERVLLPLCEVHSAPRLYRDAIDIQERWRYGFYDSLILAAALSARCEVLYSEDFQHGQRIRDLEVRDPFR